MSEHGADERIRRVRVVHWGTGNTGTMGLKGILGHPDLEFVGCFVARPEPGRDRTRASSSGGRRSA